MPARDPSRPSLPFVALVLLASGCAGASGPAGLAGGEPVFCYAWLTDALCYAEPFPDSDGRLLGVYLGDPGPRARAIGQPDGGPGGGPDAARARMSR